MKAYLGQQSIKDEYVARIKNRIAGLEEGQRSEVRSILDDKSQTGFEAELGAPLWMDHLLDALDKNTSSQVRPTVSLRFLEAIKPGVDLEPIKGTFLIFVLNHCKETVAGLSISDELKQQVTGALDGSIALYETPIPDTAAFVDAYIAAQAAADAVDAGRTDLYVADNAAARSAARAAIYATDIITDYIGAGAGSSVRACAHVCDYARAGAGSGTYDLCAEKFIDLIAKCEA